MQAFTFEFGGKKRVVVSGYEAIHKLLIKNADYTSTRSTNSMTADVRQIAEKTPGIYFVSVICRNTSIGADGTNVSLF